MSVLGRNVVANFVARAVSIAITVLLPPIYARLMGIESYALITFYTFLSTFLGLLDLGFSSTLTREVARLFRAPDYPTSGSLRTTVLTYERVFVLLGLLGGAVVVLTSPLLATKWLHVSPGWAHRTTVSIALMGLAFAAQWPTSIYQAILYGAEEQILANFLSIAGSAARAIAALAVLALISPSPSAFFLSQAVVAIVQTAVFRIVVARSVLTDSGPAIATFDWAILAQHSTFSAGVFLSTILGFILGQGDKLILSRVLPLATLGYYGLASALAAGLYNVGSAVYLAVFPRFVQLVERPDKEQFARLYHLASQLVAAFIIPATLVALMQPYAVLEAWTGQPETATMVQRLLGPLALGTGLNVLLTVPSVAQLAHKWTSLSVINSAFVAVLMLPTMYIFTRRWGAVGAAESWALINVIHIVTYVPLMHRRILRGEMSRWYADLLMQAVAAFVPLVVLRTLVPQVPVGRLRALGWISLNGILALGFATLAASALRQQIWTRLKHFIVPARGSA